MRIIGPLDQKPFLGVAIAAVSGLMLGGAMKPELNETALFRAPQLLQPVSGERVEFVDRRTTTTAYRHGTPEWVIRTDWLRPAYPQPEPMAEEPEPASYALAAWEPPEPRQASYSEPTPSESNYPSLGGDILGGPEAPEGDGRDPEATEPPAL